MSAVNGVITVEVIINPCLYWVISADSKLPFLVGIYDVVPNNFYKEGTDEPADNLSHIFHLWKNHNSIVKEVLSRSTRIEFHGEFNVDSFSFGNIHVRRAAQSVVQLRQFLIANGIAAVSKNPNRDALLIKTYSMTKEDLKFISLYPQEQKRKKLFGKEIKKPKPLIKPSEKVNQLASHSNEKKKNSPSNFVIGNNLEYLKSIASGRIDQIKDKMDDFVSAWCSVRQLRSPETPAVVQAPVREECQDVIEEQKDFGLTQQEDESGLSAREREREWIADIARAHIFPPYRARMMAALESASNGGTLSSSSLNSSEESVKARRIGGVGRGVWLKEASERSSSAYY